MIINSSLSNKFTYTLYVLDSFFSGADFMRMFDGEPRNMDKLSSVFFDGVPNRRIRFIMDGQTYQVPLPWKVKILSYLCFFTFPVFALPLLVIAIIASFTPPVVVGVVVLTVVSFLMLLAFFTLNHRKFRNVKEIDSSQHSQFLGDYYAMVLGPNNNEAASFVLDRLIRAAKNNAVTSYHTRALRHAIAYINFKEVSHLVMVAQILGFSVYKDTVSFEQMFTPSRIAAIKDGDTVDLLRFFVANADDVTTVKMLFHFEVVKDKVTLDFFKYSSPQVVADMVDLWFGENSKHGQTILLLDKPKMLLVDALTIAKTALV